MPETDLSAASHPLTREYSQRLGVLTATQLQAALDRFDLGTLVDAQPAPGGLFGQNVLLTSTAGEYVLRGAPHYDGQFAKERFFSRLVHERTEANAPWPFLIERSPDLFGWSYALMPRLPGEHLPDPFQRAVPLDDHIGLAWAMGEHLALMQTATWDAPGEYDHAADELAPLGLPFPEWFVARTRAWLAQCLRASTETTPADVDWIESIIASAAEALAVPFAPVIVHTDYAEGNVVAERGGDGWRVTGVFDLGDAFVGDGEYDLARLATWYGRLSPEILHAFIEAYAARRPLRDRFATRMQLYILAERLIIWEYGQRNKIWFKEGMSFRTWAEQFVGLDLA